MTCALRTSRRQLLQPFVLHQRGAMIYQGIEYQVRASLGMTRLKGGNEISE
jgi:hypothetical protein